MRSRASKEATLPAVATRSSASVGGGRVIGVQQLLIGVPGEPLRVEAEHQLVRRVGPPHAAVEPGHSEQVGGEVEQQRPGVLVGQPVHARPGRRPAAARSAASSSSETTPKL